MKTNIIKTNAVKKAIFWIPAILLMIVIFYFSSQPAEVSGNLSGGIAYRCVRLVSEVAGLGWSEAKQQLLAKRLDYPLRKLAHATEYALLGISIAVGIVYGGGRERQRKKADVSDKRRCYIWVQAIGSIYAASDEIHQLFVPGRAGLVTDVLIDSVGVLIGWWVFFLLLKKTNYFKTKESSLKIDKNNKNESA